MIKACLCSHVLYVSDPVFSLQLSNRLQGKCLLAQLVLKSFIVLICLYLEQELSKNRNYKLFPFYFWKLGLLLFDLWVGDLACLDHLVQVECSFRLILLKGFLIEIPK